MSELDFGGLWQTIPVRLGHDEILDAAVMYHLDCQDFFKTQSDTSALTLLRSGTKAMEAMRLAVAKPRRDTRNAVAISMVVLAVAEERISIAPASNSTQPCTNMLISGLSRLFGLRVVMSYPGFSRIATGFMDDR
jgi:hypothetical protein